MLRASRPIDEVIPDETVDAAVRDKLRVARDARAWAVTELALPDNGSYKAYADIGRSAVLWNVFAAGPLSLKLKTWCFPVAGCVGYRGYYDEKQARDYAQQLASEGLDVKVGGVPAYSTLGWFDDPLPSPVLRAPETEVVRLIFHELAHQVLYVKGDSTFNESFATTVETVGVKRWLAYQKSVDAGSGKGEQYRVYSQRKHDFLTLLQRTRARLAAIYGSADADAEKLLAKQKAFATLSDEYATLRDTRWGGYRGYDRWFAQRLGNAHLAAVGAYNDRVPAFMGMLEQAQGDFARFYEIARRIAALGSVERNLELDSWHNAGKDLPRDGTGRSD